MQPQRINIRTPEDRRYRGTKSPWLLRWTIDGHERSRSFETKALAADFASELRRAKRDGLRFDQNSGRPLSWSSSDESLLDWATVWFQQERATWANRSCTSMKEALARAIVLAVPTRAPKPPVGVRQHLYAVLDGRPEAQNHTCAQWLDRWVLKLSDLDSDAVQRIYNGLGLRDTGEPLGPSTMRRFRKDTRQMYMAAVAVGKAQQSHWPAPRKGKRRAETPSRQFDVRNLPSAAVIRQIIDGVVSHQPASKGYRILSMITWMLGTRPSETRALRVEDFILPESGPGWVSVENSLDDDGSRTATKTGATRMVSVPSALVQELRQYLDGRTSGLIVATRDGNPVALSNWCRALKRSCLALGVSPISPYDFRHSCASMLLSETKAPGAVAASLGNSIETLMKFYAAALDGQEQHVADARERLFNPETSN